MNHKTIGNFAIFLGITLVFGGALVYADLNSDFSLSSDGKHYVGNPDGTEPAYVFDICGQEYRVICYENWNVSHKSHKSLHEFLYLDGETPIWGAFIPENVWKCTVLE